MFYEDPTEKNEKAKKEVDEKWSDVNRVTEKALLELDAMEKKYAGNRKTKMKYRKKIVYIKQQKTGSKNQKMKQKTIQLNQ